MSLFGAFKNCSFFFSQLRTSLKKIKQSELSHQMQRQQPKMKPIVAPQSKDGEKGLISRVRTN